ncbi:MAG: hypothetical protein PHW76_08350, partial [Alphaproteobacteria bacterium]|nr:hypothetical protein [Alphaproteobacteria bacterium]
MAAFTIAPGAGVLIPVAAGAFTGGVMGVWRASKMSIMQKNARGNWKREAFVKGAIIGALGSSVGILAMDAVAHNSWIASHLGQPAAPEAPKPPANNNVPLNNASVEKPALNNSSASKEASRIIKVRPDTDHHHHHHDTTPTEGDHKSLDHKGHHDGQCKTTELKHCSDYHEKKHETSKEKCHRPPKPKHPCRPKCIPC